MSIKKRLFILFASSFFCFNTFSFVALPPPKGYYKYDPDLGRKLAQGALDQLKVHKSRLNTMANKLSSIESRLAKEIIERKFSDDTLYQGIEEKSQRLTETVLDKLSEKDISKIIEIAISDYLKSDSFKKDVQSIIKSL